MKPKNPLIHLLSCHMRCAEKFCIDHLPGIHPQDHSRIRIYTPTGMNHKGLLPKQGDRIIMVNNFDHTGHGKGLQQYQEFWRDATVIATRLVQYGKVNMEIL